MNKFKNKVLQALKKSKPEQKQGLASLLDNLSSASLIGFVVGLSTGTITYLEAFELLVLSVILVAYSFFLRG